MVTTRDGQEVAIDVKSTSGEFERSIHISYAELVEMTGGRRYDIYRVFGISEESALMRVTENVAALAVTVLHGTNLPTGITPDSFSVDTTAFKFGQIIRLEVPDLEDNIQV